MKVNTVTIEVKEYNLLRDFKTEIEAKNTIVIDWWSGSSASVVSESVIVKACAEEGVRLQI